MPAQLALPLDAAPPEVRAHGLRAAHVHPMVGERIGPGKTFWSGRVPASRAWTYPYIVLDDAGATWATITLDCDDRPAMAAGLCHLPPPNWMVHTERGAHLTWCLARPVAKHQRARRAPETYLARTAEYFVHAVSADPGFGGLSRNPAHPDARTYWAARKPYDLDTLSSVIPFNWKRPRVSNTSIGRNVDLFGTGLRWAGRQENAALPVLSALHAVNAEIAAAHDRPPLSDAEVGGIARSIERYRLKWARNGWHCPRWRAQQASRSAMQTGKARRASESSDGSNEALKPWLAAGVSRRTWYRRRARGRDAESGTVPNTVNPPSGRAVC